MKGKLFATTLLIIWIAGYALNITGDQKANLQVNIEMPFLTTAKWGGYVTISCDGYSDRKDFGGGKSSYELNFYEIKLNENKRARITAALKNGFGLSTSSETEYINLKNGNNKATLRIRK